MAMIHVDWREARSYCAEIEIENFDPENDPNQQIREAVGELDDLEDYELASDQPIQLTTFFVIGNDDLTEGDTAS